MGRFLRYAIEVLFFILIILVISPAFSRPGPLIFPTLEEASPDYDCDDATLAMYQYFDSLGVTSTPIIGNLKLDGEAYMESNHVWLLVNAGDTEIAYDWGNPRFDPQHYEGYKISLDLLLKAVSQDQQFSGKLAAQ